VCVCVCVCVWGGGGGGLLGGSTEGLVEELLRRGRSLARGNDRCLVPRSGHVILEQRERSSPQTLSNASPAQCVCVCVCVCACVCVCVCVCVCESGRARVA